MTDYHLRRPHYRRNREAVIPLFVRLPRSIHAALQIHAKRLELPVSTTAALAITKGLAKLQYEGEDW